MVFVSLSSKCRRQGRFARRRRRYPGSPGTIPERLRKEFDVRLDGLALPRRRLPLRRRRSGAARARARRRRRRPPRGRARVRRTAGVRQYEASPRSVAASRTSMIAAAVAQTSSSSCTSSPESAADATTSVGARSSFSGLRRARALLQPRERLRPEHAEAPRLRQMVVRREPRDVEQLEQRLPRHGLGAERLVRPPRRCELGEAHARRAETWTSAPARTSSCGERAALVGLLDARPAARRRRARRPRRPPRRARRRSGGPGPRPRPSRSCTSTSSRPGGVPACVSSLASDIVMQPPCAAASSSSGLVFPSGLADARRQRELELGERARAGA